MDLAARDAQIIVIWVHDRVLSDDVVSAEINAVKTRVLETSKKRVHIEKKESTEAARDWLRSHGGKVATRLRVVTNRFRADDGGDLAAHRVVEAIHTELGLKQVPVLVYCGSQGLAFVRNLATQKNVFAASDPNLVVDFVVNGKIKK